MDEQQRFEVVGRDTDPVRTRVCRRMLVGPWCNQPEQYEGYNGFVGWPAVTRLRSGRWYMTFTSGYWHASPPWTEEVRKDEPCRKRFEEWQGMGCPDIRSPRGGRGHIMHSDDGGLTWSKPRTLIDTEWYDAHQTILELDDGTLLCTSYGGRLMTYRTVYMLSHDGGTTWTGLREIPKLTAGSNGSAIQVSDGSILWATYHKSDEKRRFYGLGIWRSSDRGESFELASLVNTDHDIDETSIAELPNGRLVTISRRQGDICWSDDGGRAWTDPVSTGVELYDPHLLVMPCGVLACFHGSYGAGGLRVMLSADEGRTWRGPQERTGYAVDRNVYGYCHPTLLEDGTIYVAYLHSGGHTPHDARTEALWGLRVGVHEDAGGIDILPAPGSPEDKGLAEAYLRLVAVTTDGGDSELGDLL